MNCSFIGIHKSTYYRHRARIKARPSHSCFQQDMIRSQVHALCQNYPTYGYRRIWALLCRKGYRVNPKTVYRVMKSEGLLQSSKRYAAKRTLRKWDLPVTGLSDSDGGLCWELSTHVA